MVAEWPQVNRQCTAECRLRVIGPVFAMVICWCVGYLPETITRCAAAMINDRLSALVYECTYDTVSWQCSVFLCV